jgi:hypothetical protein
MPGIIVRPLKPALPCTLGLIERRDLPSEPALDIVRKALLSLREEGGLRSSMAQVASDRAVALSR